MVSRTVEWSALHNRCTRAGERLQALAEMEVPESLARTLWNIIQRMQPGGVDKKAGPSGLKPTSDARFPGLAVPDTR